MKVLEVNNALAVDTLEEDALLSEVKGSSHFIRCFLLYCTILLHFTTSTIRYDLTIGLHAYINRLLGFTIPYAWELVKSYHFIFHRARKSEGIAGGMGRSQANIHLESLHLVRKNSIAETHTAGPKRGSLQVNNIILISKLCQCNHLHVIAGANCNGDICEFGHVCMHCPGPHIGHRGANQR